MFKVKPLTNYQAPRYGTANPDSFRAWAGWLLWRITSSAARRAAALLLVAGLGLGAGGCGTDEKRVVFNPGDQDVSERVDLESGAESSDQDADVEPSDQDTDIESPVCVDGATSGCTDWENGGRVAVCKDGVVSVWSCRDYCEAQGYSPSPGHDNIPCRLPANATNPCYCQYSASEGELADCTPGDLRCVNNEYMASCQIDGMEIGETCDAFCARTQGAAYRSKGCDEAQDASNICQCYLANDGDLEAVENGG